jgi:hypothetical protein
VRRTRVSLLRRAVMWGAGVVLTVSVVAWVLSMFRPSLAIPYPRWTRLFLAEGGLEVRRTMIPGESHWTGYVGLYHSWWPRARLKEAPIVVDMSRLTMRNGVTGHIFVPLWIPLAASCGVLVTARLVSCGVPAGICPSCSYDLSGITGPCPECGSERERET